MTTHGRLREATRADHEAVDAAFARFDLGLADDYRAFLRAHARAIGAAEPFAALDAPRLLLLAEDLVGLGETMPPPLPFAPPPGEAARWGMRYTLEGSRLGGAMLARGVADGLPRAYLTAKHGPGGWRAITETLDRALTGEAEIAASIEGAKTVFGLFAAAAALESSEMDAEP